MKSVSIHEFKDKAADYLASRETISVKHHDKIVGFYTPVQQSERTEVQTALTHLCQIVTEALMQSGWNEEELSQALDLSLHKHNKKHG